MIGLMSQRRHQITANLWFIWMVNFLDRTKTFALLPLIVVSLGMTTEQTGWFLFAFYITFAAVQPLAGWVVDRLGGKKAMAISVATFTIFTWTMALVGSWEELLIRNALFGFGMGFETAGVHRLIATWYPPNERARANAIAMTGTYLGAAITPLIVVPIAEALGSWRWSFMFVSFIGVLNLWLVKKYLADRPERDPRVSTQELVHIFGSEDLARKKSRVLDPSQARSEEDLAPGERMVRWQSIYLNRSVILAMVSAFISYFAVFGVNSWLPTYGYQYLKVPLLAAGVISSMGYLGGFLGTVMGGYISDVWFRAYRTPLWLVASLLAAGFPFVILTFQPGVPLLLVYAVFFFYTFFNSAAIVNAFLMGPYLAELLTPGAVGRASSMIVLASQFGSAFAQPIVAALIGSGPAGPDFSRLFIMCGVIWLIHALIVVWMIEPKLKRSLAGYVLSGGRKGTWEPQSQRA